jgi:hypothetical protein
MRAYLVLFTLLIVAILEFWYVGEIIVGALNGTAPKVPSGRRLRAAVVRELDGIDFHSVCDVGSGFGGMCGRIARAFPSANVSGIEIMPMPYFMSKIARFFRSIPRRVRFYLGDCFARIKKSDGFDVGIFYQLPRMSTRVESEIMDKFKILIVLDFPLPNSAPMKKVKLHKDLLGQHWLYVYKTKTDR